MRTGNSNLLVVLRGLHWDEVHNGIDLRQDWSCHSGQTFLDQKYPHIIMLFSNQDTSRRIQFEAANVNQSHGTPALTPGAASDLGSINSQHYQHDELDFAALQACFGTVKFSIEMGGLVPWMWY